MSRELRPRHAKVSTVREGGDIFIGDPGEASPSDDLGAESKKRGMPGRHGGEGAGAGHGSHVGRRAQPPSETADSVAGWSVEAGLARENTGGARTGSFLGALDAFMEFGLLLKMMGNQGKFTREGNMIRFRF